MSEGDTYLAFRPDSLARILWRIDAADGLASALRPLVAYILSDPGLPPDAPVKQHAIEGEAALKKWSEKR